MELCDKTICAYTVTSIARDLTFFDFWPLRVRSI